MLKFIEIFLTYLIVLTFSILNYVIRSYGDEHCLNKRRKTIERIFHARSIAFAFHNAFEG